MIDLTTHYMGLELRNPLVASASPLSRTLTGVQELESSGVGAIVFYSLFEEEIRREAARWGRIVEGRSEQVGEALSYFPKQSRDEPGPRRYLSLLERAADTVQIPLIGSLSGASPGDWRRYARSMQDAGAAAIELNVYFLPQGSGRDVEQRCIDIVLGVKAVVDVPVAVKLVAGYSSIEEMALRLVEAGVDALVLFNRYPLPDVDVEAMKIVRRVELSQPQESLLARAWIAQLYAQTTVGLAGTTGLETWMDLVKYLLVGADVVETASTLLRHGPSYAADLVAGLAAWMEQKGFNSPDRFRGLLASAGNHRGESDRRSYFDALWSADLTEDWGIR